MNGFQLEMQFSTGCNRLREALDNGIFSVWIEHSPPVVRNNTDSIKRHLETLETAVYRETGLPVSLAITDRLDNFPESMRSVEYASLLESSSRGKHVVYLSGRGTSTEEIRELAGMAANAGLMNIIPVTGNAVPGATLRRPGIYTESTEILSILQKEGTFFTGGAVNPFKYAPLPLVGQYSKMIRKLNSGADFVVAQAGFDMAKLHELRHYLETRQFFVPTVARLVLLTPEIMAEILAGKHPGIVITPEAQAQLRRELCFSSQQFQAAQWRRLELQAAGCRLLGFSGIQLVGADTPDRIKIACSRISNALKEFSTFTDWLCEYEAWAGRADLSNHTNGFYFFSNLLGLNGEDVARPRPAEFDFPPPPALEKTAAKIKSALFPDESSFADGRKTLLKKIFLGCKGCGKCNIQETFHICSRQCPKQLSGGPCGGAATDGSCELGARHCIFNQITSHAGASGMVNILETPVNGGIKNG